MTTSIPTTALMPANEDPIVRRHVDQRNILQAKLGNAQDRVARLINEQKALQEAAHERQVNRLLGNDATGDVDSAVRLSQISSEIATESAAALALKDALSRHVSIAAAAREQVQRRLNDDIRNAAREVVSKMATHGPALVELTSELQRLADLSPALRLPMPAAGLLIQWLDSVRRLDGYR